MMELVTLLPRRFQLAILLVLLAVHVCTANTGKPKKEPLKLWTPPEFDESIPRILTVMEGEPATLQCVVTKLRGRSVSWIRQRDLHVISANDLTFTTDGRFKVAFDNETSAFTLRVIKALRNDSGVYECQINTRPKLSRAFNLSVVVPAARIPGPKELFIKSGSTLVLTCVAHLHPNALSTVEWTHNTTPMTITGARGGVSIHTEKAGRLFSSKLSVVRVAPQDAGNYTCKPDGVPSASATVFIVDEDIPAAMHHDSAARRGHYTTGLLHVALHTHLVLHSSSSTFHSTCVAASLL
ncbi:protein turtle homolog A-like [Portunus trituberculatus]|uniref:protein turtle homolog A-like n=1 Tax=Portunus trituberculatus TaxID=210409 RepID=UPI001E1D1D00|nr:protein turtle homolog A-like [Portunus trituberculatus]XP_045118988.1 protein turtle homolog A-like [Portunus trituberculatus]